MEPQAFEIAPDARERAPEIRHQLVRVVEDNSSRVEPLDDMLALLEA